MSNYTKFRVIKIIDEYSIVINGGFNDDISIGDKIEIFLEGDKIVDPFNENGELGTLDFTKATLEVTEVYLQFSVCNHVVEEKEFHPSSFQKALGSLSAVNEIGGKTIINSVQKKLNIDKEEVSGRKTGDKIIRIGDFARVAISE